MEARDNHLSTGFIGTKDMMLVLAKIGRNDVACRLIHNDTFPSWGFSIKHGATSIWERWNIEDAVVLPAKHAKHAKT
ncbi:MAG: hypothetical protein HGA82_01465 [Anaerolineales bacterium]|nr:hypothetical protein [Anaerolineales bacterium]